MILGIAMTLMNIAFNIVLSNAKGESTPKVFSFAR